MDILSAKPPTLVYSPRWDGGECSMCGAEISEKTRRAYPAWNFVKYKIRYCQVEPICPHCLHMTAAEQEAEDDQRRFTKVSVADNGTALANYFGSRCPCGAAALQVKDFCVQCWRSHRMLNKAQADIRAIKKMTAELNRQIKERNNGPQ